MLAGAKQEGTSDVANSRNQPSVLEDDREPQRQRGAQSGARKPRSEENSRFPTIPGMRLPGPQAGQDNRSEAAATPADRKRVVGAFRAEILQAPETMPFGGPALHSHRPRGPLVDVLTDDRRCSPLRVGSGPQLIASRISGR